MRFARNHQFRPKADAARRLSRADGFGEAVNQRLRLPNIAAARGSKHDGFDSRLFAHIFNRFAWRDSAGGKHRHRYGTKTTARNGLS